MEPFIRHTGIAAPLDRANVDTDAIVPKQFLRKIDRVGFGKHLFHEWRFSDYQGTTENPDFILNKSAYRNATVLLARDNFGCGSSREHAAWALGDMGIKAVIAPSFSDIFSGNAFKNGILTVVLPQEAIDRLMEVAKTDEIHVDLENQTVTTPFQDRFSFEIDPFRKQCLMGGLDEIGMTMAMDAQISNYEHRAAAAWPWQAGGANA